MGDGKEGFERYLEERQEKLYRIAMAIVEPFWSAHYEYRAKKQDVGVYGIRVKKGQAGVSALWFRTRFGEATEGGEWIPLYTFVRLGRGRYQYRMRDLVDMKPWEKRWARRMEPQLAVVRKNSETLVTASKMLRAGEQRLDRLLNAHPELEQESLTETSDG